LKSCHITEYTGKRGDVGWSNIGKYVIEDPWRPPETSIYSQLSLDTEDFDPDAEFYLLPLFRGRGLVVKPTESGSFMRVGCFRSLVCLAEDHHSGYDRNKTVEIAQRFKREMEKLTAGERGPLGESVGLDEEGIPRYVIKLI
jgi:hypothetical protein